MARQVLQLTGLQGDSGWRGAVLLDPAFVAGGGVAYVRHIESVGTSIRIRLAANETGDPAAAGPEFTAAIETADEAFTLTGSDGTSLTLKGPGHPDNTFADPSEPYFWTPDNGAAMNAWFLGRSGDFTFILDDGVEPSIGVRGTAAAGAAETAATARRVPQLTLADFDSAGLELDVLALIRAGAGSGGTIYASPPRGTVGALLDGELGLSASEATITRIRRRNGAFLAINENDPLSLAGYFGPGGAGADLTVYIQTVDGLGTFPASTFSNAGGGFVQFGPIGGDDLTIVDDIADGQGFIIAFARPAAAAIALRGKAEAGGAEAAATVARVTPAIRTLGGGAAAGAAEASARVATAGVRIIRGRSQAGRPAVLASVLATAVGALYQRALRDSAPAERLLTALEIDHPAAARPVRVINDTQGRRIEGNDYVALRFDARLADDIAGQAPQAELAIDNVGRALTQWIETAQGGIGATVRVMQVLDIDDPPVEWEATLDVAAMTIDQERVSARLGFDPLLGRAAVALRHDPQTSSGLFW